MTKGENNYVTLLLLNIKIDVPHLCEKLEFFLFNKKEGANKKLKTKQNGK